MLKPLGAFALLALSTLAHAGSDQIPATPVLTLYQFDGPASVPYYRADAVGGKAVGSLAQGTSIIPCLAIRDGKPVTDDDGTPYVGFELVVDSTKADPSATERFKRTVAEREKLKVRNHHCAPGVDQVVDVRKFYPLKKPPFFDPPPQRQAGKPGGKSPLDRIVRAFHASPQCAKVNANLTGRREALDNAWDAFIAAGVAPGSKKDDLAQAKQLDYVMRTALYEAHIGRGCSAYGACERNIVALSIRNRVVGQCKSRQGCEFPGDFEGAASKVNQYNIWDEYLTQISGLTACFLRPDLGGQEYYGKIQAMYEQNVGDVERILFGDDADLQALFPGNKLADLKALRHYYHAPAMGKCFPQRDGVEYMSGAVASRGGDYALIANTRIEVGEKKGEGYRFKAFEVEDTEQGDLIRTRDDYPGFLVDASKVTLRKGATCPPYGVPKGCRFDKVGRYRKTPSWVDDGKPIEISCPVADRGADCRGEAKLRTAKVGGSCDVEMRPFMGVP